MAQLPPHPDHLLTELEPPRSPHNPEHINPKLASDIQFWSQQFNVSGQMLHEAVRVHGTSVEKVRAALAANQVSLT